MKFGFSDMLKACRPFAGKAAGLFFLGSVLACTAYAQPDNTFNYNPGRPGFACGSGALIRHTLSVETYFNVSGQTDLPWNRTGVLHNGYTLRYSPLDKMELYMGTGWVKQPGHSGLSLAPLSVGTRINLIKKQGAKPGFAFIGSLGLPVGSGSQYAVSRGVIPSMMLILDHTIGNMWVAYNVGSDWSVLDQNIGLFYCVAAGGSPVSSGRFNLYGEVVGMNSWQYALVGSAVQEGTPDPSYSFTFRFGGDVFITECLKMDLSVATSLHRPHVMEGEIGLAYGIPLKKR